MTKALLVAFKKGESVQNHVKVMIEIFKSLAMIGDPVLEEDHVVHLLASLPESFNLLVTGVEANSEVPKMEIVTEGGKIKDREETGGGHTKVMMVHNNLKNSLVTTMGNQDILNVTVENWLLQN